MIGTGDMVRSVPDDVVMVLNRLQEAGYRSYLVGGCVRDLLLGEAPADWDVAASARPDEVAACFPRTVPSSARFGTVRVITAARAVEVTSFRSDSSEADARYNDLEADLLRRDVTINAMAMDLQGRLIDPAGGRRDLRRRLIRAVGDPHARITEDPLRLLRIVRLAADKGFDVEAETLAAVRTRASLIDDMSGERINAELQRMLLHDRARIAIMMLADTRVIDRLLGMLSRSREGWRTAALLVERLSMQYPLRMAGLLVSVEPEVDPRVVDVLSSRLRWDARLRTSVRELCESLVRLEACDTPSGYRLCRIAAAVGRGLVLPLAELADIRAAMSERPRRRFVDRYTRLFARKVPLSVSELAIDGDRVMEVTGLEAGPEVGLVLKAALERVWEEPARNNEDWLCRFAAGWLR